MYPQRMALAIMANKRIDSLPDVATTAEQGFPRLQSTLILALFAPSATSNAAILEIRKQFETAMAKDTVKRKYTELGIDQDSMSITKLTEFINAETNRWNNILQRNNVILTQ